MIACGDGGADAGEWSGTVSDSAGIEIVRSTGDGIWDDDAAWTLEEIFRVGGMEAGEDARFGLVAAVDADEEGRVYALDMQAREIRVFDSGGALVSVIGGPGGGPGEFGAGLMGMFERGDTIWGIDVAGQGMQGFDLEGERIVQVPFDLTGGIPLRMDETEAGLVAQRRAMSLQASAPAPTGDAVTVIRGEAPDTLVVLPLGESFSMQGGEARISFFQSEPLWDAAEDGSFAWGTNKTYRIRIHGPEGELRRIVERNLEAQELTESMEQRLRDAILEQMVQASGSPAEALAPMLDQATFAETFPILAQLILTDDGHLWVQRVGRMSEAVESEEFDVQDLGSPLWDVFDPEGRYLGEVRVPDRFQPLRLIDGVLWGIGRDEFDVQSIVGMRVLRS